MAAAGFGMPKRAFLPLKLVQTHSFQVTEATFRANVAGETTVQNLETSESPFQSLISLDPVWFVGAT